MGANDFAKLPHIGESMKRKEDERFLTGNGQYTDDITQAKQKYAVFVRSPHAHAVIKSVDIAEASEMPRRRPGRTPQNNDIILWKNSVLADDSGIWRLSCFVRHSHREIMHAPAPVVSHRVAAG